MSELETAFNADKEANESRMREASGRDITNRTFKAGDTTSTNRAIIGAIDKIKKEIEPLLKYITITPTLFIINSQTYIRGWLNIDGATIYSGNETPEGKVAAYKGSLYLRKDGAASTTLYVKTSGDGTNTGWTAK
jgi:hypothetical protein